MRMCFHEGQFLYGNYQALNTLSWGEAMRIRAARDVIEDERGQYNDWVMDNSERVQRIRKRQSKASERHDELTTQLSLEDYQRILADNRKGLAGAQEELAKHRRALALSDTGSTLEPEHVDAIREFESIHAKKIEDLEAAILELFGPEAASLV